MENIQWMSDYIIRKGIGKKIKEWRLEVDLSQAEVASRAQMSLITYQNIEYGKAVNMSSFIRALRVLGRLDALDVFFAEKELSPILVQKIEQGMKVRKRASRKEDVL